MIAEEHEAAHELGTDSGRRLGVATSTMLVIASMIGTGVFTTSGFLVRDLGSPMLVLLAWALGGLAALFGALSYAELSAALPNNGGEYYLLSRVFHPALGFAAGIVSLVVGFSAPIAASAIAFGEYTKRALGVDDPNFVMTAGLGLIVVSTMVHLGSVQSGTRFQNVTTAIKLAFVVGVIYLGLSQGDVGRLSEVPASPREGTFGALAVSLVFVSFAYSGWNAAAYLAGETRDPSKTLPRALFIGTVTVTVLYVALTAALLMAAPTETLSGVLEVAHVAAAALFGEDAGRFVSGVIAIGLISTVGALTMTGPRVYEAIGADYPLLRALSRRSEGRGPGFAIATQAVIAAALAMTASFDTLLIYIGFTLSFFAAMTALAVIVLRRTEPDLPRPYRVTAYPLPPVVFIALMLWMMWFTVRSSPIVTLAGAATIVFSFIVWLIVRPRGGSPQELITSGTHPIPLSIAPVPYEEE